MPFLVFWQNYSCTESHYSLTGWQTWWNHKYFQCSKYFCNANAVLIPHDKRVMTERATRTTSLPRGLTRTELVLTVRAERADENRGGPGPGPGTGRAHGTSLWGQRDSPGTIRNILYFQHHGSSTSRVVFMTFKWCRARHPIIPYKV